MARLPRLVIPNQPIHIMHRGNNHQDIFLTDDDMHRIKNDINQALVKSKCQLHAYVIMTNHLHLLVTPKDKHQLSTFMQTFANRYVRYFNALHERTGTIWEGRYKSSVIDSDNYLFTLYRYIEMNPVKARMTKKPEDYQWSSFQHNALGIKDILISEHEQYKALGLNQKQRRKAYHELFIKQVDKAEEITKATERGEVYGDSLFHNLIERLVDRPTRLSRHGGDRKSENYKNQAG